MNCALFTNLIECTTMGIITEYFYSYHLSCVDIVYNKRNWERLLSSALKKKKEGFRATKLLNLKGNDFFYLGLIFLSSLFVLEIYCDKSAQGLWGVKRRLLSCQISKIFNHEKAPYYFSG